MDLTGQSLVIDKIVLNNFRSFHGKNELILGYTPEKFVNIIKGPCGSGKTTIVEALQWAFNRNDLETSTQGLPLLNRDVLKSLKNHQKAEVSVQVFLTDEKSNTKLKIERTCEYSFYNGDISLVSDACTVKELRQSQWIDVDKEIPCESYSLLIWNGEQNPTNLIENISSLMAAIRKSTKYHLPLILDSPFSHLDIIHRISIVNFLKETFSDGQLIYIGSEREFEPVMDILKNRTSTITKRCAV